MHWKFTQKRMMVAICCFISLSTHGHHSTSEFFYLPTEFEGDLIYLNWKNPHVTLGLRTAEGIEVHFIADTIMNLHRLGVRKEIFQIGDSIRIFGRASGKDDSRAMAREVIFKDGSSYKLWNGR